MICHADVAQLEELLKGTAGKPWPYPWLPTGGVHAVAHLVCAGVLRPANSLKEAMAHLQRGNACLQQELERQQISLQVLLPILNLRSRAGECVDSIT